MKEKLINLFESSAQGTLLHSEISFIIKAFSESNVDFEKLNDDDLKLIAGGRKNVKNLTFSLASIMLSTMLTNTYSASSDFNHNNENDNLPIVQKIKGES